VVADHANSADTSNRRMLILPASTLGRLCGNPRIHQPLQNDRICGDFGIAIEICWVYPSAPTFAWIVSHLARSINSSTWRMLPADSTFFGVVIGADTVQGFATNVTTESKMRRLSDRMGHADSRSQHRASTSGQTEGAALSPRPLLTMATPFLPAPSAHMCLSLAIT
jgi:hypothetical protein